MRPSRLELLVDLIWVGFSVWYVATALGYPPVARNLPLTVGMVSLVVSGVQLVGYFVPRLRPYTHPRPAPSEAGAVSPAAAPSAPAAQVNRRQLRVILWGLGLVAGLYLFGFAFTVPAFMLAYFRWADPRGWKMAVGAAAAMWALVYLVLMQLMQVHLPPGLIPALIANAW
jgi:hypothetical protein